MAQRTPEQRERRRLQQQAKRAEARAERRRERLKTTGGVEPITALEAWEELRENDLGLLLHIIVVRVMIEQRGLSAKTDLSELMGRSHTYIYKALSPHVDWTGENNQQKYTPERKHQVLYEIEDAITRFTDMNGGVYTVCNFTPSYVEAFDEYMSLSQEIREMFPDVTAGQTR